MIQSPVSFQCVVRSLVATVSHTGRLPFAEEAPAFASLAVAGHGFAVERLGKPLNALLHAAFSRVLDEGVAGDTSPDYCLRLVGDLPEDRLADDLLGFLQADPFLDGVCSLPVDDDPHLVGEVLFTAEAVNEPDDVPQAGQFELGDEQNLVRHP